MCLQIEWGSLNSVPRCDVNSIWDVSFSYFVSFTFLLRCKYCFVVVLYSCFLWRTKIWWINVYHFLPQASYCFTLSQSKSPDLKSISVLYGEDLRHVHLYRIKIVVSLFVVALAALVVLPLDKYDNQTANQTKNRIKLHLFFLM